MRLVSAWRCREGASGALLVEADNRHKSQSGLVPARQRIEKSGLKSRADAWMGHSTPWAHLQHRRANPTSRSLGDRVPCRVTPVH